MSVQIPLTRGLFATVDDCDAERIGKHRWYAAKSRTGSTYARRKSGGKVLLMHRVILGVVNPDTEVDHADRDGLNNTRGNLRICTRGQNLGNQKKQSGRSSKFKGVFQTKKDKRWAMSVGHWSDRVKIVGYLTEEAAARAYDEEARYRFGRFARLNFPRPGERGINQQ